MAIKRDDFFVTPAEKKLFRIYKMWNLLKMFCEDAF